ncbi:RING-H2 finger protein ATL43 [Apostasia shenzhenica]|uniref:RING-type E3 ubiquitin transferase n=1 Tax=Apostasia shenzhenica TaxID=1088818 RepID=A0A2I0A1R8_9ASPA|nr:RING-H2 finger protein ATL43 [Apostasia shenzhenica]
MGRGLPRALLAADGSLHPPLPAAARAAAGMGFRPSIIIVVVVLSIMLSLTCLLLLYAKHCRRQGNVVSGPRSASGAPTEQRSSGVERSVVEALPIFRFGSIRGEKQGLECPVCLGRFEPAELLRLLPKCRHAFHVDCVDAWLASHSTCPLCRSRVDPEDALLLVGREEIPPLRQSPTPPAEAVNLTGATVSGRHSAAEENCSRGSVRVLVHRHSESGGAAAMALSEPERQRKDGLLLWGPPPSTVMAEEGGRSHRVAFSVGEGAEERWSDLRPSDLIFLRSERSAMPSGHRRRSASEIAGERPPEEEEKMRKWLRFAGKRTEWWSGG